MAKKILSGIERIEIRSEDIEDILGKTPNQLVRYGISIIFAVILVVLVGSWFFKYPDVIKSTVTITTENPPAALMARTGGKIQQILVTDNQQVEKGDYLVVIENPANYQHMFRLAKQIDSVKLYLISYDPSYLVNFDTYYSLGEIQSSFATFLKHYLDYQHFSKQNLYQKKIQALYEQTHKYNAYYNSQDSRKRLMEDELNIGKQQYNRDSSLYANNTISKVELEQSQSTLLQKKYQAEGVRTELANTKIQIAQLNQSIIDQQLEYENQKKQLELILNEAYNNLLGQIAQWEQNYVLKAPINGKVVFNQFWSVNQNVQAGNQVLTIVPNFSERLVGKIELPIQGSGKVKVGQRVNIQLLNYPHMEYGMVEGVVKSKSLVSANNFYSVEVDLPNGLVSNYKKKLEFNQGMQGMVEIITDDVRLLERILKPLKSILKRNIAK